MYRNTNETFPTSQEGSNLLLKEKIKLLNRIQEFSYTDITW